MNTYYSLRIRDNYEYYNEDQYYEFQIERQQTDITQHHNTLYPSTRDYNTEYSIIKSIISIQNKVISDIK